MDNTHKERLDRRAFLAVTGGIGVASLAGCVNDDSGGSDETSDDESQSGDTVESQENNSSGESQEPDWADIDIERLGEDPEALVETYAKVAYAVDRGVRRKFQHSVSIDETVEMVGVEASVVEEDVSREVLVEQQTMAIDTIETLTAGEVAIVEATLTGEISGSTEEDTLEYFVATEDGEWRVIRRKDKFTGGGTVQPAVDIDFEYSAETDTVEITHTSGDSVEAANLSVRGENIADGYTGSLDTIEGSDYAPDDWVSAGDAISVEVTGSDFLISVVWESGSNSAVLAEYAGPDAQS